jgi:hypothetical protein
MRAFKPTGLAVAFFIAFSGLTSHVKAADLPAGYTCQDLRTKVAEYGVSLILASARSRGFSETAIAQIRGKCRV